MQKLKITREAEEFLKRELDYDVMTFVQKSMSVSEGLSFFNANPDNINTVKETVLLNGRELNADNIMIIINSLYGDKVFFEDLKVIKAVAISLIPHM